MSGHGQGIEVDGSIVVENGLCVRGQGGLFGDMIGRKGLASMVHNLDGMGYSGRIGKDWSVWGGVLG